MSSTRLLPQDLEKIKLSLKMKESLLCVYKEEKDTLIIQGIESEVRDLYEKLRVHASNTLSAEALAKKISIGPSKKQPGQWLINISHPTLSDFPSSLLATAPVESKLPTLNTSAYHPNFLIMGPETKPLHVFMRHTEETKMPISELKLAGGWTDTSLMPAKDLAEWRSIMAPVLSLCSPIDLVPFYKANREAINHFALTPTRDTEGKIIPNDYQVISRIKINPGKSPALSEKEKTPHLIGKPMGVYTGEYLLKKDLKNQDDYKHAISDGNDIVGYITGKNFRNIFSYLCCAPENLTDFKLHRSIKEETVCTANIASYQVLNEHNLPEQVMTCIRPINPGDVCAFFYGKRLQEEMILSGNFDLYDKKGHVIPRRLWKYKPDKKLVHYCVGNRKIGEILESKELAAAKENIDNQKLWLIGNGATITRDFGEITDVRCSVEMYADNFKKFVLEPLSSSSCHYVTVPESRLLFVLKDFSTKEFISRSNLTYETKSENEAPAKTTTSSSMFHFSLVNKTLQALHHLSQAKWAFNEKSQAFYICFSDEINKKNIANLKEVIRRMQEVTLTMQVCYTKEYDMMLLINQRCNNDLLNTITHPIENKEEASLTLTPAKK